MINFDANIWINRQNWSDRWRFTFGAINKVEEIVDVDVTLFVFVQSKIRLRTHCLNESSINANDMRNLT